jgi:hypothetical protein
MPSVNSVLGTASRVTQDIHRNVLRLRLAATNGRLHHVTIDFQVSGWPPDFTFHLSRNFKPALISHQTFTSSWGTPLFLSFILVYELGALKLFRISISATQMNC